MSEDSLLSWRSQFPILEETVYMVSHSLGAMPRGAYQRLREYADLWARRGVTAWRDVWWEQAERVGDMVAGIIGAPPGSVSMHQNATLASAVILSCLDFDQPRGRIIMTEMDFPSIVQLHRGFPARGAELVLVPSEDGVGISLERLLEAIDERTRLVAVSHVFFKSSFLLDAAAVVQRAHEVGALVALDIYQSAGALPVDVRALGVDFAVGGCHKWLCGGAGGGYLYVRPELAVTLQPRLTGWFAHARPFDFELEQDYAPGSRRFLNGTTALPSLYAVQPGLEILGRLDIQAVRAKSRRQTSRIIDFAQERGWPVRTPLEPERRGGTVTVDVPQGQAVEEELVRRGFLVDYRPGAGVRMAPHFYNGDGEVEALCAELAAVVHQLVTA